MKTRTFKNPQMQKVYDHYRTAEIKPDRNSSDRAAYWNGREGLGSKYPHLMPKRSFISYAIYVAGVDRSGDAEEHANLPAPLAPTSRTQFREEGITVALDAYNEAQWLKKNEDRG